MSRFCLILLPLTLLLWFCGATVHNRITVDPAQAFAAQKVQSFTQTISLLLASALRDSDANRVAALLLTAPADPAVKAIFVKDINGDALYQLGSFENLPSHLVYEEAVTFADVSGVKPVGTVRVGMDLIRQRQALNKHAWHTSMFYGLVMFTLAMLAIASYWYAGGAHLSRLATLTSRFRAEGDAKSYDTDLANLIKNYDKLVELNDMRRLEQGGTAIDVQRFVDMKTEELQLEVERCYSEIEALEKALLEAKNQPKS